MTDLGAQGTGTAHARAVHRMSGQPRRGDQDMDVFTCRARTSSGWWGSETLDGGESTCNSNRLTKNCLEWSGGKHIDVDAHMKG